MDWQDLIEIKTKKAENLADFATIHIDLNIAIESLNKYQDDLEAFDKLSYLTIGVIFYARCFVSGVRMPLPLELFDNLEGEAKECHDYFINLRHKYICHSVNSFEQVKVGVMIDPKSNEIIGVGELTVKKLESKKSIKVLIELAKEAKKYTKMKIEELRGIVKEACRNMDRSELLNNRVMKITTPEHTTVDKKRK